MNNMAHNTALLAGWNRMHRDELLTYLADIGAVKTTRPGVFRAPGKEIVCREVGSGYFDVREVACNC